MEKIFWYIKKLAEDSIHKLESKKPTQLQDIGVEKKALIIAGESVEEIYQKIIIES